MVYRVTTSDNEWQQVTTNGTASDNEWQRTTTSDNEWRQIKTSLKTTSVKKATLDDSMDGSSCSS